MQAPNFFFIREKRGYAKLMNSSVVYLEARKNYVKIVTTTREHMVLATLGQFEDLLDGYGFHRIHRGFVINLDHLTFFDRKEAHVPGKRLPIGDTYYSQLKNAVPAVVTTQTHTVNVQL